MSTKKNIINKLLTEKSLGNICLNLVIFSSFYYPIGATLIIAVGVPSTPVNMGIKLIAAIVSLALIMIRVFSKRNDFTLPKPLWVIFVFWIFYSCRLIFDLSRGIHFSHYSNDLVYGYAFGAILLPILAIFCWRKTIDIKKIPTLTFWFFLFSSIAIFITMIIKAGGFSVEMFLIRPHLKSEIAEQKAAILNPIQIGYYGELLALSSLYFMLIAKKVKNLFYFPPFLFGVMLLFLGASRGPFVSFTVCAIVLIFYRYRVSKQKLIITLKYAAVVFAIVGSLGQFFDSSDFMLLNRLEQLANSRTNDKKEYRDYQWASAWQDFLDSPVYGKQFVGTMDTFYPHNIILEVLMATGLIGGTLFGYFLFSVFRKIWRSFRIKDDLVFYIAIVSLPILTGSLFSGCLFQSVELWLMMVLFISMPMQRKKFKKVKVPKNYAFQ